MKNPGCWEIVRGIFTVERIMTPRDELFTYSLAEMENLGENGKQPYDVIPVMENERIIGVKEIDVSKIQALSDHWLVTRDTSIPELLDLFVTTHKKAFLVYYRQEAIGLVSPADMNKLPTRVYIYNLIGELEMGLANLIRTTYGKDIPLSLLSEGRQADIQNLCSGLDNGNASVDMLELFYLSDLITVIQKDRKLLALLSLSSRKEAERLFSGINELRNSAMHLVKPILSEIPKDLEGLKDRIGRMEDILHLLEQFT